MHNLFRHHLSRLFVGLGLVTIAQVAFMQTSLGQYQGNEGDIVVIGEDPAEWSRFRSYWQQLLQLNPAPSAAEEAPGELAASESDPAELEAEIKKNLTVSNLELKAIFRLSGSSQVTGMLTNKNKKAVTVASVSYEIVDGDGNLLRSGAATPQPSTIEPGQSVTFNAELFGFPRRSSYEIRLTQSPFVIQGGV